MADSKPICSVEGCSKPRKAKGVCLPHYHQTYSQGECSHEGCSKVAVAKKLCSQHYKLQHSPRDCGPCVVPECESRARTKKGLCSAHDHRQRRYGTPEGGGIPSGARLAWLENNKGHEGSECLPWPYGTTIAGYGQMRLDGVSMPASRAMCILAHGRPSTDELEAAHSCGNPICCNPRHLRWATPTENNADKRGHGTHRCGESIPWAKLREDDVKEIRRCHGRDTISQLARRFGVSSGAIYGVVHGKSWAWLD